MSISRQNLTVIIVTFMSENVIHDCIKSLPNDIKIIVVDNSNNKNFKESIEKQYKNIKCILSKNNLGMGPANNLGLKEVETDYAFILNPDVVLEQNTLDEIFLASSNIDEFSVIAPISKLVDHPNYKLNQNQVSNLIEPFQVDSIDGYAMILNLKKINNFKTFINSKYFDENIFMYLENDDLCKRIIDNKGKIFVVPKAKINHIGGGAVDAKYKIQIELSRNWHWIWSKFYFNKKHKGYMQALIGGLPSFLSAILKFIFHLAFKNKIKKEIYLYRASGYLNAALGNKSYFRPRIDISDQEN